MPSTTTAETAAENTLARIQQDIMENTRREKELHEQYRYRYGVNHPGIQRAEELSVGHSGSLISDGDEEIVVPSVPTTANGFAANTNGSRANKAKPQAAAASKSNWSPLLRIISSSSLLPPQQQNCSSRALSCVPHQRRFGTTSGVRGVMEKFIKSRGKITQVKALSINDLNTNGVQTQDSIPDLDATISMTVDPTKRKFVRKNFISIEERMKREFQEMHSREKELHAHRKSLSNLNLNEIDKDEDYDDSESSEDTLPMRNGMKSARSMGELFMATDNGRQHSDRGYDSEDDPERYDRGASSGLGRNRQMAKSLAQLCDTTEEELFTPDPQAVIMHFEKLIRKSQQNRA